jgi:hypothetical protein
VGLGFTVSRFAFAQRSHARYFLLTQAEIDDLLAQLRNAVAA